jgi:hypothetical protein
MDGFPWREECVELLWRVDPYNQEPLYLLSDHETAGRVDMTDAGGIYCPAHRYCLRETIKRTLPWRGPGFVCVIRVADYPNTYAMQAVVLHEYAHHVEMHDRQKSRFAMLDALPDHNVWTMDPRVCDSDPTFAVPWERHDSRFIRVCVHLSYRAQRCGWLGDVNDILNNHRSLLSRASTYGEQLGCEPAELIDRLLSVVVETEPPTTFARFAKEDVRAARERLAWLKENKIPTSVEPETDIVTAGAGRSFVGCQPAPPLAGN